MNSAELQKSYAIVKKYSSAEIVENLKNINKLVTDLMVFSSISKTNKEKDKFKKYAVAVLELIPSEETSYNTGLEFSIGRDNTEIYAQLPEISKDDEYDESITIYNSPGETELAFDMTPELSSMYEVDSSLFLDESLRIEEEKEKEKLQIEQLFQLAKRQGIILDELHTAYKSDLWKDNEKKWSNNTMKVEIAFLQDINLNSSVKIINFGEKIAIQRLYEKANNPEVKSEDILMNCIEIPCIQKDELDMKKTSEVFESFFRKNITDFEPGSDILYINFEGVQSMKLEYLADKYDSKTDLMYRIFYFTQVIQSLQEKGVKIKGFSYKWKEMPKSKEKLIEDYEVSQT